MKIIVLMFRNIIYRMIEFYRIGIRKTYVPRELDCRLLQAANIFRHHGTVLLMCAELLDAGADVAPVLKMKAC